MNGHRRASPARRYPPPPNSDRSPSSIAMPRGVAGDHLRRTASPPAIYTTVRPTRPVAPARPRAPAVRSATKRPRRRAPLRERLRCRAACRPRPNSVRARPPCDCPAALEVGRGAGRGAPAVVARCLTVSTASATWSSAAASRRSMVRPYCCRTADHLARARRRRTRARRRGEQAVLLPDRGSPCSSTTPTNSRAPAGGASGDRAGRRCGFPGLETLSVNAVSGAVGWSKSPVVQRPLFRPATALEGARCAGPASVRSSSWPRRFCGMPPALCIHT